MTTEEGEVAWVGLWNVGGWKEKESDLTNKI